MAANSSTRAPRVNASFPISGMTCKACEARVAKTIRRLDGVHEVKVSLAKGVATVSSSKPVSPETIDAALRPAGYRVASGALPILSADKTVWRDALIGAAAMAAILWGLDRLGLMGLTDRLGSSAVAGSSITALALVFALGVIASISTCMALVGGLVLSVSAAFAKAHPELPPNRRLRPQFMFNLGRVAGFGALGAALGALGGVFQVSVHLLAFAMIAVGLVMGLIGLKLTEVSPRLSRLAIALPASWARLGDRSRGYRDSTALALGAASFFLPCGFTQAVQVYALSTGSPARAGLIMAAFALGTAPGLLGVGALAALASGRAARHVFRLVGVAVCAFAAVNLMGGAQILRPAWFVAPAGPAPTARSDNVVDDADVQVLRTVQNGLGYSPKVATVYADRPVRWEIDSQGLGCTSTVDLSAMGLGIVYLEDGLNVFEFTPTEVGTLAYTCAMGMAPAQIHVIAEPADAE
ncbi:MAG: sulfite exporter TauE/SafE family protein [Bifidobacteriaceae bacterium]|jgi:sulfite exporter TauE/SafE/copper chaperone CopZ|nr:sulfite exporter TauE/SafE family protein [Bifidobacteriaceae bacterium]